MEDQVAKVKALKALRDQDANLNYLIEIDGGVTDQTKAHLSDADVLVAGSFIFKNQNGYGPAIEALRKKSC